MQVIPHAEAPARAPEIAALLREGGLACFPVGGVYRLVADARSEAAVTRLMQSKRRARNHPTLVIVTGLAAASDVVEGTTWPLTRRLAQQLWPGPLTLTLAPSPALPSRLRKLLTRATGKVGVRVPEEPLPAAVLRSFDGPLLLSSANLEKKPGSSSAATVRQRFVNAVEVWVDAGDLAPAPPSTVVDVDEAAWKILREGAIARERIERLAS